MYQKCILFNPLSFPCILKLLSVPSPSSIRTYVLSFRTTVSLDSDSLVPSALFSLSFATRYDLTYKACGCKCGKGHLRKDLDWIPPPAVSAVDAEAAAANGKKKRRNRRKARPDRPSLVILSSNSSNHNNNNPVNNNSGPSASNQSSGTTALSRRNSSSTSNNNSTYSNSNNNHYNSGHGALPDRHRDRTSSMSSSGSAGTSNGGVSPPIFATDLSRSPDLQATSVRKLFFGESERNRSHSLNHNQQQPHQQQQPPPLQQQIQAFRERSNSGTMFGRRPDYSTFNILPRTKINSYHIRMEDETSHGNDDIRTLILSTLSSNGMNCVHCIVCSSSMPIFERFPLIDGTFFLSPRQHSKAAVQIVGASIERKFLNAVCMGCMEGWNSSLRCRSCRTKWDGSHLILGSMYSYDIFAAVPCCISRLKCCNCNNLAISAGRRLEFFSDYSQNLACSHCGIKDFHFVKPLYITFMPSNAPGGLLVMKS